MTYKAWMLAAAAFFSVEVYADCPPKMMPWTETQMFFGRGLKSGGQVTEDEWKAFVREEITSRFSAGFTVLDASGFWKGCPITAAGVCENSKVLLVQYEATDRAADAKLDAIAEGYAIKFHQEAVMRSDHPVCTRFYAGSPEE